MFNYKFFIKYRFIFKIMFNYKFFIKYRCIFLHISEIILIFAPK